MTDEQKKRVQDHLEHLAAFFDSAKHLAMKLFDEGEIDLGRLLLANSLNHDRSKLFGVEWEVIILGNKTELLKTAVEQHNHTNEHHPEYFGSIHKMDDVHIAEMVCDWRSRSSKFGTSLRDWIDQEATERYQFTKTDPVYAKIMRFVAMILDEPYKRLT